MNGSGPFGSGTDRQHRDKDRNRDCEDSTRDRHVQHNRGEDNEGDKYAKRDDSGRRGDSRSRDPKREPFKESQSVLDGSRRDSEQIHDHKYPRSDDTRPRTKISSSAGRDPRPERPRDIVPPSQPPLPPETTATQPDMSRLDRTSSRSSQYRPDSTPSFPSAVPRSPEGRSDSQRSDSQPSTKQQERRDSGRKPPPPAASTTTSPKAKGPLPREAYSEGSSPQLARRQGNVVVHRFWLHN